MSDGSDRIVLGERYELGEVLGRGGMAEVRRGRDLRLGRSVAVKMLRTDLAREVTFQNRFRREAQSAASLNHPSIVAVYDTGEDTVAGGRVPYIVMEYVEGTTLRDLLISGRKLLPERALEITRAILAALDYSHRNGIVHRDIKPANVMLTPDGAVKVMDFGIARALADESATMTQASGVMGTAKYLSPEQARGEQVDVRTDLYSTGCLLYELLVGRPPFDGDNMVAVAYQHVGEIAALPSSLDPEISPAIDAVVMKALAKDRPSRYQTAAEMSTDIERVLAGVPVTAMPVVREPVADPTTRMTPVGGVLPSAGYTETRRAPIEPPPPSRSRAGGWIALVIAALAVFVLAILAAQALNNNDDAPSGSISVPSLKGKTVAQASALLIEQSLTLGTQTPRPDSAPVGEIVDQSPEADVGVDRGTPVNVTVSTGTEQTQVPKLTGLPLPEAEAALKDSKLSRGSVTEEDSQEKAGQVLRSDPPEGTPLDVNNRVNLVVSSGKSSVPDVENQLLAQAKATLADAGFTKVEVIEQITSSAPPGTVLEQSPPARATRPADTQVTLTVAVAPPVETTPPPPPVEPPVETNQPPVDPSPAASG